MANKIEDFVLVWNKAHPIDLWWRKKHNIPFMSKQHRSISFIDQLFEFYEDRFYNEAIEDELKSKGLIDDDDRSEEEKMADMENEFEQFLKDVE